MGGKNVKSVVKRLMSKLFSDSLLSEFSHTGKKGKKKFSSLFICSVIFGEYLIIINVIDYNIIYNIYFSNKITYFAIKYNSSPRNLGGNQFLSDGVFRQHQLPQTLPPTKQNNAPALKSATKVLS